MRGFVMVLMIFDHASMSFDRNHLDHDSALYADATTMALPADGFFHPLDDAPLRPDLCLPGGHSSGAEH
jgi:hypothetical protein